VLPCPACGTPNPDTQKFCGECGARLPATGAGEEQRKTVTVLFSDVTGSTALGERLEPESLRRMLAEFFEAAKRIIESHGGTVEKFIGDAVMAVFGVPVVHEDDAIRALRAARELMAALDSLNPELERSYGASLAIRIGVNTGEVVTGTSERLATGDAVNVAARLEQLATPGEIYVGEVTAQLAASAADLEELEPATLKGKAEPVRVFRLRGVSTAQRRVRGTRMVGRERQLDMLRDAFDRAVADRACVLFTVLGPAGVGKSRLVAEFLDGLDAVVVRGRCLSYGHGVGLLPAADAVRQLQEGALSEEVASWRDADPAIAAAIRALVEGDVAVASGSEIAWAFRRIVEQVAATRPVVIVLDDLHWAEPPLFDVIDHLVTLSRDAPILLLVMARPELLERRQGWGGGALNASTVLLEPLGPADTAALVESLAPTLDERSREKVMAAAGGNPLFAEEMVALVEASGASDAAEIRVPPTIQALLAARLDQLDPAELRALERGSIEGQTFHRGAVTALTPEDPELPQLLLGLVRKDLLRPDQPTLHHDEAFRFRHLLLRDAAYERLPKSMRAELHERFARWLDDRAPDLPERDSLVGYHLEQAHLYRAGLGPSDDTVRALALEAADRLERAGKLEMKRRDLSGAIELLDRSVALRQDPVPDVWLQLTIASALVQVGRPADAVARDMAAAEAARRGGDRMGALVAEMVGVVHAAHVRSDPWVPTLQRQLDAAMPEIERSGDDAALAWTWFVANQLAHNACRFGDGVVAAKKLKHHALRSEMTFFDLYNVVLSAHTTLGPTPIPEALVVLEQQREHASSFDPWVDDFRAELLALTGDLDEAAELHRKSVARLLERGSALSAASAAQFGIRIETLRGDLDAAIGLGLASCAELERMGETAFMSTLAALLAEALFRAGRYDESRTWARRAMEVGDPDDAITHAMAQSVLAMLDARSGDEAAALEAASEALRITDGMQAPQIQGDVALNLAGAFRLLGDIEAEEQQLRRAFDYFSAKGSTLYLERTAKLLDDLAARR
jgi:class 3 adenylate cyclase/tetratricopeptide (TPR) repeat protein